MTGEDVQGLATSILKVPDTERDERLRGIQERAEAATEGPWSVDGPAQPGPDDTLAVYVDGGTVAYVQPIVDDAAFIAAARTDVPWLLEQVTRLDAVVTAVSTFWKLNDGAMAEDREHLSTTDPRWALLADLGRALDGGAR